MKYIIFNPTLEDVERDLKENRIEYTKKKRGVFTILSMELPVEEFCSLLTNDLHGNEVIYVGEEALSDPTELRHKIGQNMSCFCVLKE